MTPPMHELTCSYLASGLPLRLQQNAVNPLRKTVTVHRPGQPIRVHGMGDVFNREDVVPGWNIAVHDLFDLS